MLDAQPERSASPTTHPPRPEGVIGVDVGGTFTDIALELQGRRVTHKVLTTPRAPEEAIVAGIREALAAAGVAPNQIGLVIHGTTLLTNALIERKGPAIAFLTTAGHRDTLEIATESRFHLYDLFIDKPRPLVPREWRLPIRERLDVSGRVLQGLDEGDVVAAAKQIADAGISSVAVGFLHSYVNPAHERRAAEILRAACGDVAVTLSSEVAPEIREYDRFNTACANAFVKPIAGAYLRGLAARLAGIGLACPLFLMHSGGGMIDVETAVAQPIRLLESGPAGGAIFAASVARELGIERAICFDMGGTTAKVCFVDGHRPRAARHFELDRVYRFLKGSGLPLRIPVIELVEIGAGGGSIAAVDRLGGLGVGPESAGSEPGPACFGRGGTKPTVTDADVVLGRIRPEAFAGGTIRLDAARARSAIADTVAAPLGVAPGNAAHGIAEIVDENMANAARVHALELGRDPTAYTLIAFGGAGPLHAGRLAEKLGIRRLVIPADAGVGSAVGFLRAPLSFEVLRSLPMRLGNYQVAEVGALLNAMMADAEAIVARAGREGARRYEIAAFMRYVGQGHELEIVLPEAGPLPPPPSALLDLFEDAYESMFARRLPRQEVEILSWRVRCALPSSESAIAAPVSARALAPTRASVQLGADRATDNVAVHDKRGLTEGAEVPGPAVIVDQGTTVLIPAAAAARIARGGHIDIRWSGA